MAMRVGSIFAALASSILFQSTGALAQPQPEKIAAMQDQAIPILRSFAVVPLAANLLRSQALERSQTLFAGQPESDSFGLQSNRFEPKPLFSGYPLIQTKGMIKGRGVLYISDTGRDGSHRENARIWKFDPSTRELTRFYEGPLLTNSKWLTYIERADGRDELIVSDYGEEPNPRDPGTGVGAKVFAIPVMDGNSPGQPRIIHEGAPFRSPEGVTVVGSTVILADWAAGEETNRPENPSARFRSGRVFAMPLDGGEPRILFPDHKWITVIGVSSYTEAGKSYLRFIDIDGGRHDKSDYAALPQSGLAKYFRAEIVSTDPLQVGELVAVPFREEHTVALRARLSPEESIVVEAIGDGTLDTGIKRRVYMGSTLGADGSINVVADTNADAHSVDLRLQVLDKLSNPVLTRELTIPKKLDLAARPMDPKTAAVLPSAGSSGLNITVSADATSQSLFAFPGAGGVPVSIWSGKPLVQPIGVQNSFDGRKIWITDQAAGPNGSGAIYEVDVPNAVDLLSMYIR
ncbi:hypothetical protein [Microvirga sp. M2]|uniref:hypothetical protein n=1 Tax=Microvirga sp. M2 TaxID=3073270 RepID=UPI0039C473D5